MSARASERAAVMFRTMRIVDSMGRLSIVEPGDDCGE